MAVWIIGYIGLRDLIPFYAFYALLFGAAGLSVAQISSLYVIWSLTAIVFEVPSGAWADTVSRRWLLVLSSALYGFSFAAWILTPTYAGFAAGFVLWGISGALMSGTIEALTYDELAVLGQTRAYASLMGWASSASVVAILIATVLAAPLYAVGGYRLVGWVSVGVALLQGLLALSLPSVPQVAEADEIEAPGPIVAKAGVGRRYLLMLRSGLREAARHRPVRNALVISSLVMGLYTYDEYLALLADSKHVATAVIPLLVAITSLGEAVGTALAGRTSRTRNVILAAMLGGAAVFLAAGDWVGGVLGFFGLAIACGLHTNVMVVVDARLQDVIEGPARATVTSATGLVAELVAITTFAIYAVGSAWSSVSTLIVLLAVPLAAVALLVPSLTPSPTAADVDEGSGHE